MTQVCAYRQEAKRWKATVVRTLVPPPMEEPKD